MIFLGSKFKVQSSKFKVQGSGFRVQSSGLWLGLCKNLFLACLPARQVFTQPKQNYWLEKRPKDFLHSPSLFAFLFIFWNSFPFINNYFSILHHPANLVDYHMDILKGITFNSHNVGEEAGSDGA